MKSFLGDIHGSSHSFEDHSSSPFVIFRGDKEETVEKVAKELKPSKS